MPTHLHANLFTHLNRHMHTYKLSHTQTRTHSQHEHTRSHKHLCTHLFIPYRLLNLKKNNTLSQTFQNKSVHKIFKRYLSISKLATRWQLFNCKRPNCNCSWNQFNIRDNVHVIHPRPALCISRVVSYLNNCASAVLAQLWVSCTSLDTNYIQVWICKLPCNRFIN